MPKIIKIEATGAKNIKRKRVAAYARVSEECEQLLHSLAAQVSYYSNLIQSNPEWEYAGVYADEGISGVSIKNRKEFQRLLADCAAGKIDLVLTKSISRFARNTVDLLETVRHLKEIGVEVRFERENISTFTADGELLLTLLASFAQAESESLSDNIRWTARKRFQQGIPNGHSALYGYKWDGEMYRIVPEQGKIVREIYERYLAGEFAYSISRLLTERGVKGPTGGGMYPTEVTDIISNIAYTGTMVLQKSYVKNHMKKRNKGELPKYAVEDMYEPLVSKEEFEQAQRIRKQRASEMPEKTYTPFSGIVKCGKCGYSVSRRTTGARKIKRWVCNKRERQGMSVCDMRPIREEELIETARQVSTDLKFKEIILSDDRIEFTLSDGKVKTVCRQYGGENSKSGFSGKICCGSCEHKYIHDSKRVAGEKERVPVWSCRGSCKPCDKKNILEKEVRRATIDIIGKDNYEGRFAQEIQKLLVYSDRFEFIFKEGTVKTWLRR